jgi:hypothetical protein
MVFDPSLDTTPYTLCVFAKALSGRVCLPEVVQTAVGSPPGSEASSSDCQDLMAWSGTDFRPFIEISLDGALISGRQAENALEARDPMLDDGFYFCYRIPLESGRHHMRYVFEWPDLDIRSSAEWEFTLTE